MVGSHIAALVVEKSFSVAYQVLQVANLRRIDGGVIALGDDAIGDRVPDSTGSRIRGTNRLFCASRPSRWNARSAGSWILADHYVCISGLSFEKAQTRKCIATSIHVFSVYRELSTARRQERQIVNNCKYQLNIRWLVVGRRVLAIITSQNGIFQVPHLG